MNIYSWLFRREFWENRAIWLIPSVFGGLVILGALFGHVGIPVLGTYASTRQFGSVFLVIIGLLFYAVMSVYATWYLLDCLHTDRKDRSILFWKSLPISDAATVLSKLTVGLVLIPIVYFAAADVTALITAFILSVRARHAIGSALWQPDLWLQIQVLWIYAIIASAIWYLPVAGWLLAVSAWAKRAVILWSILPPLVLYMIERVFFGSNFIGYAITRRLMGLPMVAFNGSSQHWSNEAGAVDSAGVPTSVWRLMNVGGFFSSAETWIGVAVGVALIVFAIQMRARRTEI